MAVSELRPIISRASWYRAGYASRHRASPSVPSWGVIGLARILTWQALFGLYGEHALLLGLTIIAASLLGVVLWVTLAGSKLPLA